MTPATVTRPRPGAIENRNRPEAGEVEQRSAPEDAATVRVEGNTLHGLIPYGVESRDLGGWTEVIEPGALDGADLSDLVATLNHAGVPLGRFDSTLKVESRSDGFAWSVELGDGPTAQDVKAAVARGDLRESSWRMVVGKDDWTGTTRRISEIRSLRDVAVVTTGAYPADATRVELRERPQPPTPTPPTQEAPMPKPNRENGGGLAVEDRAATGGADIEARIIDAMAAVPSGEKRDLTHATAEPVEPPELSTFVWDNLRDRSVLLASGVPVIPTNRRSIKFPTITGDIEVDFYDELEEIDKSDPELDELEVEPRAVKGLVRGSSEAFEDASPDLLNLVQTNLATSMALRLDQEGIVGNSTKGFKGLTTMSGTQSLDMAKAAFADYDPIIAAVGLLAEADVPGPYAVIMHPRVATALDRLKEFTTEETNVPLARPDGLPPIWVSKKVGLKAGSGEVPDTSPVVVYAPKSLAVVRRLETTIEVDRSQEFDHDAVFVRGKARAALGTAYPEAVVVIKNVAAPKVAL
ncbi:MAG TPA: phage major capsid protein [Solirubrobacterales bacterium]|nr:phage major capsid protein [Solirubrobacterales bacterium]